MKKFLTHYSVFSLLILFALTSCQQEDITPDAGNDSSPTVREGTAAPADAFVEVGPQTPYSITDYREVIIDIPTDNPDIRLRMAFPDEATYLETIQSGKSSFNLADFKFLVNRGEVRGRKVESHMVLETYDQLKASVAKGKLPIPVSGGGVMGRGMMQMGNAAEPAPVVDLILDPVATTGEITELTDSNCPYLFGCSGDCAMAGKIDGVWHLFTGDCRRAYLVVCYCHTTAIHVVP